MARLTYHLVLYGVVAVISSCALFKYHIFAYNCYDMVVVCLSGLSQLARRGIPAFEDGEPSHRER